MLTHKEIADHDHDSDIGDEPDDADQQRDLAS
jgi:hypothetical protein